MEKKKEEKTLYQALADVKAELEAVAKDKENPFHKNKYADINGYLAVVEPLMQKNGLLLLQPLVHVGDAFFIKTQIIHVASGDSFDSILPLPTNIKPQELGSAITYYRRYTLGSLLAMQAEDDDANAASGKSKTSDLNERIKNNGNGNKPLEMKFKYNVSSILDSEKCEDFKRWVETNRAWLLLDKAVLKSSRKIDKYDSLLISTPSNGVAYHE